MCMRGGSPGFCCREGNGVGLRGGGGRPAWPVWTRDHLCKARLGPCSLGLRGGWLVGRAGAGRPPCPPWSARPSAVCWKLLSLHTVGPICEPSLLGNWDAELVGRLAGPSWGPPAIQAGPLPVFSPLDTRTASSCSSFTHPHRHSCMH